MRIALSLSTAFVTTLPDFPERERRIRQYINGFRQIAEVSALHPIFDVFLVDNTVEDPTRLDCRLTAALDSIPTLKQKYYFWDNETGRINKGSGLVVQWQRILPDLINRYEFTVHYEPRQNLADFSFFERMASQPNAYVCAYRDKLRLYGLPLTLHRFWTGFFSIRTADLNAYAHAKDRGVMTTLAEYGRWRLYRRARRRLLPGWLAEMSECIEADLPKYVRRHGISLVRLNALGSQWHEEATGKMVEMVDRVFKH